MGETIRTDWGEIARREGLRIFKAARALAPDDDTAWDCVQEALLTAVQIQGAAAPAHPVEWLCGVAANKARHAFRGRSRFRGVLDRLALRRAGSHAPPNPPANDRASLNRALGRLSPKLRDAVILRFFAGMTMAEIAGAQGGSESAAKMRVHRGLAQLRRILGASALAVLLLARFAEASGANLATAVAAGGAAGGVGATGLVVATAAKAKTALLVGAVILIAGVSAVLVVNQGGEPPLPAPPSEPATETLLVDATGASVIDIDEPTGPGPRASEEGRGRVIGVVLSPEGDPAAKVRISFARAGSPPRTCPDLGTSTTRTDEEGRFTLPGIPPNVELMVVASKSPCKKTASESFTVPDGGEVDGIIIRLLPGASVFGRVVTETGAPVASAAIRVTTGNTTRWVGPNQPALLPGETTTDAKGRYRLGGLERRTYRVFAEKKGHLPVHRLGAVATFDGGEAPTLVLRTGMEFHGVMVDRTGEPVAGGTVSVADENGSGGRATTDENGRFVIDTVLPGPHEIHAGAQGHQAWLPRDIVLPTDGPYRIRLTLGLSVVGTVLDEAGEPVPHAIVDAWDSDEGTTSAMADEEGGFTIDGLPRDGSVTVTVRSASPLYPDITVRCDSGERVILTPAEPISIAGRVVHPDGRPGAGARVDVRPTLPTRRPQGRGNRPQRQSVKADRDGRFEFEGLRAGRFTISASGRGCRPALPVEVTGENRGVLLRLREGLEAGASGVHPRLTDRGTVPFADLRSETPDDIHGAGWRMFWAAVDETDVQDESDLIEAMPNVLAEISTSHLAAAVPFAVLRRLETPAAVEMMVKLFEAPGLVSDEALHGVAPHLLAVEHPRLGPAAIARLADARERGAESWVTLNPLSKLLARHGGEEGARVFIELLREKPGYAVMGLEYAHSPLILEAGLAHIEGAQNPGVAAEAGVGLIKAFGDRAQTALLTRIDDESLPLLARRHAVAALAAGCDLEFADRLMRIDPADDPEVAVLITTGLASRRNLEMEGARAEILRKHARALVAHPEAPIRIAMLNRVRYDEVFMTEDFLRFLEERAESEPDPRALGLIREATTNIRKALDDR